MLSINKLKHQKSGIKASELRDQNIKNGVSTDSFHTSETIFFILSPNSLISLDIFSSSFISMDEGSKLKVKILFI